MLALHVMLWHGYTSLTGRVKTVWVTDKVQSLELVIDKFAKLSGGVCQTLLRCIRIAKHWRLRNLPYVSRMIIFLL